MFARLLSSTIQVVGRLKDECTRRCLAYTYFQALHIGQRSLVCLGKRKSPPPRPAHLLPLPEAQREHTGHAERESLPRRLFLSLFSSLQHLLFPGGCEKAFLSFSSALYALSLCRRLLDGWIAEEGGRKRGRLRKDLFAPSSGERRQEGRTTKRARTISERRRRRGTIKNSMKDAFSYSTYIEMIPCHFCLPINVVVLYVQDKLYSTICLCYL